MADRPIIFSGPMVRALLEGRKSMTRRVLPKAHPNFPLYNEVRTDVFCDPTKVCFWYVKTARVGASYRLRYEIGDRLYVREAHRCNGWAADVATIFYRASEGDGYTAMCEQWAVADHTPLEVSSKWRSSIHMPRWASRLTLTVTDVRVQRVQEISEADAVAEGATDRPQCSGFMQRNIGWSMDWSRVGQMSAYAMRPPGGPAKAPLQNSDVALGDPKMAFANYFNDLHGPGAWDANSWVAALTFAVQKGNIDA